MDPYIFKSLLHHFRTGADEYLKEYEKNHTQNKIHSMAITMAKPTARSTVSAMKDYIRANRLNKAPILLGMKREELIAGLRKLGHWDAQHDGTAPKRKAPAPRKPKAPAPKAPVRAIADRPAPARAPAQAPKKEDKRGGEFEPYRVEALDLLAKISDRLHPEDLRLALRHLKDRKSMLIKNPKLTSTHFEYETLGRTQRTPYWTEMRFELKPAQAPAPKKRSNMEDNFEAYRVEALGMLAKIRDRMSPEHIASAEKLLKNRKSLLIKEPKLTPTHFEFDSKSRVGRSPWWYDHKYELMKKEAPARAIADRPAPAGGDARSKALKAFQSVKGRYEKPDVVPGRAIGDRLDDLLKMEKVLKDKSLKITKHTLSTNGRLFSVEYTDPEEGTQRKSVLMRLKDDGGETNIQKIDRILKANGLMTLTEYQAKIKKILAGKLFDESSAQQRREILQVMKATGLPVPYDTLRKQDGAEPGNLERKFEQRANALEKKAGGAPAQAPAQAPARAPAPKKQEVDRIERAKLTREFQREHKKSVWQILTLKPTATREAVKARGRELMRKHHPDKGGDKATFQRVQQAVKLLMDTFGPVR